jgi:hypothetical protein
VRESISKVKVDIGYVVEKEEVKSRRMVDNCALYLVSNPAFLKKYLPKIYVSRVVWKPLTIVPVTIQAPTKMPKPSEKYTS